MTEELSFELCEDCLKDFTTVLTCTDNAGWGLCDICGHRKDIINYKATELKELLLMLMRMAHWPREK